MYPELKWSEETYMLWRIEHQLRSLAWGLSDKKHRPPQEPQPLKTPGQLQSSRGTSATPSRTGRKSTRF